ncbi:MAG: High potential iron-sulfur protein, partial [Dokdonella sp.]
AKKFPTHKPTQDCANCKFFTAGSGEYGPCQLFPGKSVHAKGWCSAHADKA